MRIIIEINENDLTDDEIQKCIEIAESNFNDVIVEE